MVERDEEAVRRFVERLATTLYELGFPRMPARVLGALLVAEDGAMNAAELGDWLRISPAAVSGATRYLAQVNLIVREPVAGARRDRYRVMDNAWYIAGAAKNSVYKRVGDVVAEGAAVVGDGTRAAARVTEMADFFLFLQDEIAAVVERWQGRQVSPAGRSGARPAGPDRR
jgi:DNA-binding transcriptional regulator GbsR (MarR family)